MDILIWSDKVVFALQKCVNCNRQFSWSKIYKSFWWAYKPIECDNCNTEYRIRLSGRFVFVSLTLLPMLIFSFFLSPFSNPFLTIGMGLTILLIGSLFTPYLVRYKLKK
ncbi:TIGR04104 family putative zinc finger protein [Bacillus sp. SCS-151]|uniref:TIGR04104 family putative zinc finger protein n=1 Tax=Nanhaiella sioensis TaxID=3115293 RepID=UPI00397CA88B